MVDEFDYTNVFPLGAKLPKTPLSGDAIHKGGLLKSKITPQGVTFKFPDLPAYSVISGEYPNYRVRGLTVGDGLELTGDSETIRISRKNSVIPANMTFARNNGIHVRIDSSKMRAFGAFIYPGTNNDVPITKIKVAVMSTKNSITLLKLQVKNINTGSIIANINVDNPSTTPFIIDLGTISNLPDEETILELQASRSGSNDHLNLLSWQIL